MSEQSPDPVAPEGSYDDQPEQMRVRRDKRQQMLDAGLEPYAPGWPRTHTLARVRAAYPDLAPDTYTGEEVSVTGRVMFL
ncbi:MAG: lysine--tRNA ligase, partial [Actinomycetes bacterium]